MKAGKRLALTGVVILGVAVVIATTLRPVLTPLTQRTPLPAAAQMSAAGVPVPQVAKRCSPADEPPGPGWVRWCMPSGVSAHTLRQWYATALPPGRTTTGLRWCIEEQRGDGSLRALWSTGTGLVGYILPPQPPRPLNQELSHPVAVEVLALAGAACSPVTRTTREQA